MLVAAAVCPHPPLLVADLAGDAAGGLEDLGAACASALEALRATEPELLVVVGTGPVTRSHGPGTRSSFAAYGGDREVALPGEAPAADGTRLPLSISVGAWLLERAGWTGPVRGHEVAVDASVAGCRELGRHVAQEADRVGLLVMGDGSARRSTQAPGFLDPRAEGFDASAVDAMRAGDPAALLALDTDLAAELLAAGRAAWQVLAGAAGDAVFDADVLYDDAPYGVQYVVAVWERHG
ncbi:MAG: class III extradiol dioxygenase subunit B-like domain-containing protein [Jiangellaceae bacterium]